MGGEGEGSRVRAQGEVTRPSGGAPRGGQGEAKEALVSQPHHSRKPRPHQPAQATRSQGQRRTQEALNQDREAMETQILEKYFRRTKYVRYFVK